MDNPSTTGLPEIPGYTSVRELGRGAMGVVYLAQQNSLKRLVAVKVLNVPDVKDTAVSRFLREVRLCIELSHPNVVKMLDAGATDGLAYLVMEFVDGVPLDSYIKDRGPLKPNQLLQAMEELADAMDFVHSRGIVHRDLKPGNVMAASTGVMKMMDFGLARGEGSATLTEQGNVVGSPRYLAPETVVRGVMDQKSDLYGLGLLFHEAATGQRAFHGTSLKDTLTKIVTQPLTPPSRHDPAISTDVDAIVLKLCEKDPQRRYGSAKEALEAIRAVRSTVQYLGTSWETSRPLMDLSGVLEGVTAAAPPVVEPTPSQVRATGRARPLRTTAKNAPVGATGSSASDPQAVTAPSPARPMSGRRTTSSGRVPVVATTASRAPQLIGALILALGIAVLGISWFRRGPAIPLVSLSPGPPSSSLPSPLPTKPPKSPLEELVRALGDADIRVILKDLQAHAETLRTGRQGSANRPKDERRLERRRRLIAYLDHRPFHGRYFHWLGRKPDESPAGLEPEPLAVTPTETSVLQDPSLPADLRRRFYNGLLVLSQIDDALTYGHDVGPLYRVRDLVAPWALCSDLPQSKTAADFDRAVAGLVPGVAPLMLHTNVGAKSGYVFSGIEDIDQEFTHSAGPPVATGYKKKVDDPLPIVTLPAGYRVLHVAARTRWVSRGRLIRLVFVPLVGPGPAGEPPGGRAGRTVLLRCVTPPSDTEAEFPLVTRVSSECLPPGKYSMEIRTFQLVGTESVAPKVFRVVAVPER